MNRCDACKHKDSCVCVPYGCECFELDLEEHDKQIRTDAFADCVLENGEYCWQECCATEHCKECKCLGNGDTIWFEL